MSWKVLNTKTLFDHPRITLLEDEVVSPDGTITHYLKFKDLGGGADIVAVRDDGKILLQSEYNHPIRKKLWQFPGGLRHESESYEATARRELIEESGYKAADFKLLGFYYNNRRRTSEVSQVYLASHLSETTSQKENEEADLEHFWFSEQEIEGLIKKGEITGSDTLAIWTLFKVHRSK